MTRRVGVLSASVVEARVRFLGLGFFLVFVAYSSAQLLQTALNGGNGYICLFLVYACFGSFSLVSPSLVDRVGPNVLLPLSAIGYALMTASNIAPVASVLLPSCVLIGACAATLWSAQAVYMSRCALTLSQRTGIALTQCTSNLNLVFYQLFMCSGAISGLLASAIMMSGVPNAVTLLFLLLTGVGALGVVSLASLPLPSDPTSRIVAALPAACGGSSEATAAALAAAYADEDAKDAREAAEFWGEKVEVASAQKKPVVAMLLSATAVVTAEAPKRPSPLYMLYFVLTNRRVLFLLPAIFANGSGAGYINGTWMASAARLIGFEYIGLIGCVYAVVSAVAARYVWKPLAQSRGRRFCFLCAIVGYSVWYSMMAAWLLLFTPRAGDAPPFAALFCLGAVHGLLDPVLQSLIPATLQVFFSSGRDSLCAMSSIRVVYSAGFAGAQALSLALAQSRVGEQSVILAFLMLAAGCSLYFLHNFVCAIDLSDEEAARWLEGASSPTKVEGGGEQKIDEMPSRDPTAPQPG